MTTSDILFNQPGSPPGESEIKLALGPLHSAYRYLISDLEGITCEWKFYGAKYGWQLKASGKGKALFYLVPRKRSFTFGCAIRDEERDLLLSSRFPAGIKRDLRSAKKYQEGFPLRIQVAKRADASVARRILTTLLSQRQ